MYPLDVVHDDLTDAHLTEVLPRDERVHQQPELRPGDTLGNFRVMRIIQSGGFGSVYEAQDTRTGEIMALKLLHARYLRSSWMKRFEHEARILTELGHPNIVEMRELGTLADGRPYIAMELLEGRDLCTAIEEDGRLTLEQVIPIIEPLCSALRTAHARGVIHRDLKTSNVFLARDGEASAADSDDAGSANTDFQRVVLLDFGIAKSLTMDGLTASGQVIGTPSCMAPEQLAGRPVDPRTDVYGLGTLLFTMLTGRLPFDSNAASAVRHALRTLGESPRVSHFVPVPRTVDDVVARAMHRERPRRFRTVDELMEALRELATGEQAPGHRIASSRSLLVMIDLSVAPELLENPDDALLDDLESIVPRLALAFDEAGFTLDAEAGNSAIFSLKLTGQDERAARQRGMHSVLAGLRDLGQRAGADHRIAVHALIDLDRGESAIEDEAARARGVMTERPIAVATTASAAAHLALELEPTDERDIYGITLANIE